MKKLFTMLVATVCATMAYAQEVTVKDVTMSAGETPNMEVSISNVNQYTAFQFDLALPTGFSVKNASLSGTTATTRKLEKALYDEATNKWRFLSYDEGNAKLAEGTTVNITLEAADGAEGGDVAGSDILVVTPEAVSTAQASASAKITISGDATITVGSSGKTTYVCSDALDFTDSEAKAYIVMGSEKDGEGTSLWLAQIDKVPAETPIVVKAVPGTYSVKKTTLANSYFKNYLIGNNTDAAISVTPEGSDQYLFLSTSGFSPFTAARNVGAHKAYVRIPTVPASNVGDNLALTIGSGQRTSLCANLDLDFSDQTALTAYTIVGWDGAILMAPVKRVSAGTPLYIKGPQGSYTIKSSAVQAVFANMLVGNNTDAAITIHPTDGDYTNYFLSSSGFSTFSADRSTGAHKSYLQVLTSCIPAASRGTGEGITLNEIVVDVTRSIIGDDDNATGISRVAAEAGNDTWYNLNGQRIDTPTKKGLYIKNGKKVIVK